MKSLRLRGDATLYAIPVYILIQVIVVKIQSVYGYISVINDNRLTSNWGSRPPAVSMI